MKSDFLVIGSGSAGLSFALKVADQATVTIVTKGELNECNTNYAQGGICSVTYAPDTFEKHIEDTLVCGAGKCDPKAVELVVKNAPRSAEDLIRWEHASTVVKMEASTSTVRADTRSIVFSTIRTLRERRLSVPS